MENFITISALLFIGLLLRQVKAFPGDSARTLNLFIVHVALPALILLKVPGLSLSRDLIVPIAMPWLLLVASALLVAAAARRLRFGRDILGSLLLVAPLGNTSFLGIPMVQAFFGEGSVPYAVLYDQLGSFLALSTYGTVVLAIYGSGQDRVGPWDVARRILSFPPFLALVAAFLAGPLVYPPALEALLKILAATLVPVVMIAVGMQLKLRLAPEMLPPLLVGLAVKLIVAPLLALSVCAAAGLHTAAARTAVFEAGMPPMITAGALALIAGLAPELTAAMVGLGILASFLTLPVLHGLISFVLAG